MQSIRTKAIAAFAGLIVAVSGVALTTPAQAAPPRPVVTLKATTVKANVGALPAFTFTAVRVPKGATLEVQRQFGTAHIWKRVARAKVVAKGAVKAPKLTALGQYTYRLAVMRGTKALAASKPVTVRAYKNIPFATICASPAVSLFGDSCGQDTVVFGGRVHTYIYSFWGDEYPQFSSGVEMVGTTCDSLRLSFYGGTDSQGANKPAYAQVVQERSDPVSAEAAAGTVGTLNVRLDGSTWYLNGAYASDGPLSHVLIDASSTAHCYTQSGAK